MANWALILKIIIILITPIGYAIYKRFRASTVNKLSDLKDKRKILLEKIKKAGFSEKEVFVSVEDFFDGNEDTGSIGANIYPEPPSLREFYYTFKKFKHSPKTDKLLIRIADIDEIEWFYTDMIYISGNYTLAEIKKMFKQLKPDEIYEGMMYDNKPSNIPQIKPGNKAYSVWWD